MNARLVLALVAIVALLAGIWFLRSGPAPSPATPQTPPSVPVFDDDGGLAVLSVDLPEVTLAVLRLSDGTGKLDREYTETLPRFQAALAALGQEPAPAPWLMVEGALGDKAAAMGEKARISLVAPVPEDSDRGKLRAAGLERHVIQGGAGLRLEIEAKSMHGAVTKADGVLQEASSREGQDILGRRWYRPLPTEAGVRFEATADLRDEPSIIDAQGPQ